MEFKDVVPSAVAVSSRMDVKLPEVILDDRDDMIEVELIVLDSTYETEYAIVTEVDPDRRLDCESVVEIIVIADGRSPSKFATVVWKASKAESSRPPSGTLFNTWETEKEPITYTRGVGIVVGWPDGIGVDGLLVEGMLLGLTDG